MKVTIFDKFTYYTIPETNSMIDVSVEDLLQIGKTKCFDVENQRVINYDNSEEIRKELREKRKPLLDAFDKWEKAVLRNREEDSAVIMQWFEDILNLKQSAFDNIPERIEYYL